jgi:hypothetical protein
MGDGGTDNCQRAAALGLSCHCPRLRMESSAGRGRSRLPTMGQERERHPIAGRRVLNYSWA